MNNCNSFSTNREQICELIDQETIQEDVHSSFAGVQSNKQFQSQLKDIETQSSRVVIINPTTNIKSDQTNNNEFNNQFSQNAKKYGVDELIDLQRVRELMTKYQKNKQVLKDIYNVNKIINKQVDTINSESSESISNKEISQSLINNLDDSNIFIRTPTGCIFNETRRHIQDKQEFMHQFGGAVVLYFKTLKLLAFYMIILSFVCLFQIILNVSINYTDPKNKSTTLIDQLLYSPSIASIASINRVCGLFNLFPNVQSYNYTFSCPQGTVDVNSIIIESDCHVFDPFLDVDQSLEWKSTQKKFRNVIKQCEGLTDCTLDILNLYSCNNCTYYISNSCKVG